MQVLEIHLSFTPDQVKTACNEINLKLFENTGQIYTIGYNDPQQLVLLGRSLEINNTAEFIRYFDKKEA